MVKPALSNNGVISTPEEGNSIGRRNLLNGTTAGKSGDSSYSVAKTTVGGTTSVVVNIFGQEVAWLQVKSEKMVWDCRVVQSGIYFYNLEIEGRQYSGKIVIQK